jgi:hypothetical protein
MLLLLSFAAVAAEETPVPSTNLKVETAEIVLDLEHYTYPSATIVDKKTVKANDNGATMTKSTLIMDSEDAYEKVVEHYTKLYGTPKPMKNYTNYVYWMRYSKDLRQAMLIQVAVVTEGKVHITVALTDTVG